MGGVKKIYHINLVGGKASSLKGAKGAKGGSKKIKGQGLTKADLRTYKQLNLAKTLRGMSKKKHAKEARRHKK